ncbi:MAG: right-handed parallel beta-helix repeat-containing protein [Phycisphaerales bacterium]|nr:hypothetical protein [Planctomycetota bacterium]
MFDKIARSDAGLAEPRTPVQSLPGSATAQYVISQPGSYYLTQNIQGTAGKSGIAVDASDVSIDLGGFRLSGSTGTRPAIEVVPGRENIAIFSGCIASWQDVAIEAISAKAVRVAGVTLRACNSYAGQTSPGDCIRLGERGCVSFCSILDCLGSNVYILSDGLMENNLNLDGDGSCFFSIFRSIARGNVFRRNNGGAITIQGEATIIGNYVGVNGGIEAGSNSTVLDNVVESANFTAIRCDGTGSLIANNRVSCNAGGLKLTNAQSARVEGNQINSGGIGIEVDAGSMHCIIIRNTVRAGGASYSISPGNSYGPIVNVSGVGDITSVANANHPWANFSY